MKTMKEMLDEQRAALVTELNTLITAAETEERLATDQEETRQGEIVDEVKTLDGKIAKQVEIEEARAKTAKAVEASGIAAGGVGHTELRTEPYRKGGKESYFRDLADAKKGNANAVARLVESDRHREDKLEQRAGTTTVAGAGGEFAPPLWVVDEFIGLPRPGRPVADAVRKMPLPTDVSSISLPKITTGTSTATQSTQNTAIGNQDIVTTSVTTNITTQAGGVTVSRQILDQSPVSMDEVILADLQRDLDQKIDLAVINAIAAVSGLNAITYTDASPTTAKLLPYIQQGIDQVGLGIYTPNELLAVVRTDRWGRFIAGADTTGRPFVLPNGTYGPFNVRGVQDDAVTGQGRVGTLNSIPTLTDAQVPNNLGAGTNQDEIFVLDPTQIFLFESTPQADAFEQTYANTLSVYCRIFEYYGIIANRLPKAISLITGTGLIPYAYGS
jgi:HK97 family phage major capsid protein